jgi:hypothetical protein
MYPTNSKKPQAGVMSVTSALTEMQQLDVMAAKLLETALRLPAGPACSDFLKEIGKFGVRIAALKARGK